MFCRNCGSELPEGVKFCISCGTPVAVPEEISQASTGPVNAQPKTETKRSLPAQYRFLNVMGYGDDPWPYVYPTIDLDGHVEQLKSLEVNKDGVYFNVWDEGTIVSKSNN